MINCDSSDELAERLTLTVNDEGTRRYRNSQGQLHRLWGPAAEYTNGTEFWYQNGKLHRTTGAAVTYANGDRRWFINGHRLTEQEFHDQLK